VAGQGQVRPGLATGEIILGRLEVGSRNMMLGTVHMQWVCQYSKGIVDMRGTWVVIGRMLDGHSEQTMAIELSFVVEHVQLFEMRSLQIYSSHLTIGIPTYNKAIDLLPLPVSIVNPPQIDPKSFSCDACILSKRRLMQSDSSCYLLDSNSISTDKAGKSNIS
jgi:hypothetical protein